MDRDNSPYLPQKNFRECFLRNRTHSGPQLMLTWILNLTSRFTCSEFVNIYYSWIHKFQKGGKCNKALLWHSVEENLFKRLKFKAIKIIAISSLVNEFLSILDLVVERRIRPCLLQWGQILVIELRECSGRLSFYFLGLRHPLFLDLWLKESIPVHSGS